MVTPGTEGLFWGWGRHGKWLGCGSKSSVMVLDPVVFLEEQFMKHHQMWLEPAVREWSLLLRNLILCQYVKLDSLNRKTQLEITLRAENCVMFP